MGKPEAIARRSRRSLPTVSVCRCNIGGYLRRISGVQAEERGRRNTPARPSSALRWVPMMAAVVGGGSGAIALPRRSMLEHAVYM
jgi:acetyl-CoA carboxylase alpha subunit